MSNENAFVEFERIGRKHSVPNMPVAGDPGDLGSVAEQAHNHARTYLGSRWFDITVTDSGAVLIEGGRFGRGRLVVVNSSKEAVI